MSKYSPTTELPDPDDDGAWEPMPLWKEVLFFLAACAARATAIYFL